MELSEKPGGSIHFHPLSRPAASSASIYSEGHDLLTGIVPSGRISFREQG